MKILIISSSYDEHSRSHELARRCEAKLSNQSTVTLLRLKDFPLSGDDLHSPRAAATYRKLHTDVVESDGLVLVSPVYNWSCCAELKRFVEIVGSTPVEGSVKGAFYDKVITFVNAAGLPHSYTAFTGLAISMMLDFKCIISPYNLYVHNSEWQDENLGEHATHRLNKSMDVFLELTTLLKARTYRSGWEI
jgi:NAD(P)H-dependent FMN reductase